MYPLLKVVHLAGVGLLFMSVGGLCVNAFLGGTKASLQGKGWTLILVSMKSGLILTIGTALPMLTSLGGDPFTSGWVHAKLTLWFVLGVAGMLVVRNPQMARGLWIAMPFLLAAAAWLAGTKPF